MTGYTVPIFKGAYSKGHPASSVEHFVDTFTIQGQLHARRVIDPG